MNAQIIDSLLPLVVPIADLKCDAKNARKHGAKNLAGIRGSLKEYGQRKPIVVNKRTGVIEAGNGTLDAARALGWSHIAVVYVDDDPTTAAGYALADNRTAELAEWDNATVEELLSDIEVVDDDLAEMLADLEKEVSGGDDDGGKAETDQELKPRYAVLIDCDSEDEQAAVIEELDRNGLPAKALFTGLPPVKEKDAAATTPLVAGEREIRRSTVIQRSTRVKQVEGIFDVAPADRAEQVWRVKLPIDAKPWNIGLIVGPSGSGKSTMAREFFGERLVGGWPWPADQALLDGFPETMSVHEIVALLSSVGFSSPPGWLKPYGVLSNGEQFRVNLARTLCELPELAVVDEFTSVVDRTVAQVGSAAMAKAVRARGSRFVAVTCHYDVEEWLQPDWKYDVASGDFAWRLLRRRPEIQLSIRRADRKAWAGFSRYHYLSSNLHKASACYVGSVNGRPAAFVAVLTQPHASGAIKRESRCVCLPDFQGVGIGNAISEFVAGLYSWKWRYHSVTSHPAMIAHRLRSPNWEMTRKPSLMSQGTNMSSQATAWNRLTATFKFVGPDRRDEAKVFGVE